MLDVRAVIQFWKHAHQAKSPNGSPPDEFDEPIGRVGVWSDQHRAASVLAVVEGEEQAAAFVPIFFVVAAQCEGPPPQLCHAYENAQQVAKVAERFEIAIRERAYVRGKADAEEIERISLATGVRQTDEINGAFAIFQNGLQRRFGAGVGEIAQERIAGAQRQKAQ